MEKLKDIARLVVSQKIEWGEVFTSLEFKNRYGILNEDGELLYTATEEGGSWLTRIFLQAWRPFEIVIRTPEGTEVFRIKRPFRWYFHTASIYNANGELLGSLEREFTLLRRIYSVKAESGEEACKLFGPILHPWTFEIKRGETVYGKITKKWSGLAKEIFTTADNFGVELPREWAPEQKVVFLGALFLIDFVHFERDNN